MLKRVLIIFGLISLIFIFGFWAENQLKTIDFKEIVKTPMSGLTEESREKAKVAKVIDGDTIELSDKRKIRYIGINSFEMNDERLEIKCLAEKAREANRNLVENKEIEMEKDVSDTDKYGRLLRYVWIDGILVNEELVKNGWAEVSSFPPDIKYQERFRIKQIKAKLNDLGIWGNTCQ
jgi:micrococcal nuclease